LELINDILDISKIEAGRMEINSIDFDLQNVLYALKSMFKPACEKKQLRWEIQGVNVKTLIHGDEGKLRQVLINLVGNAIKFTETGGVSLIIEEDGNNKFRFKVKDTGKGIPSESLQKIFQPFQQDSEGIKKGGTGLGLAITKKQIDLMNGDLIVESEVGIGSTFIAVIPLPPAKDDVPDRVDRNKEVVRLAKGYKVKALVADDIKENRCVLINFLEDVGIETIEAENGKEAVELFREHQPDVTFMDIRMPIMNGIEAINHIKKEFPEKEIKFIVISASVLKHEKEEYESLGCKEIILKPFRIEKIFSSVKNLLGIEYEYKEIEPEKKPLAIDQINYTNIQIPGEIISRLKEASSVFNITKIHNTLEDIEPKNNDEELLCETIKDLLNNFELESISIILEKLKNSS
jgi:CheY-like chemotaxis protein